MITLVYGGSSSGKSQFAENLMWKSDFEKKYYLATMKKSDDTKERISRHRSLREGKGFLTLEFSTDIPNAVSKMKEIEQSEDKEKSLSKHKRILLLECMSNLVANEMFRDGKMHSAEDCCRKILEDVQKVSEQVDSLIIVTNNVFEDGISYDEGTKEYLKCLGRINQSLARLSDEVYEVVVGIGIRL